MKLFEYLFILLLIFIAIIFGGCAPKTEIVVQEVMIPVKCKIELRSRPKSDVIDSEFLKSILKYTELLEKDLNFCINGK